MITLNVGVSIMKKLFLIIMILILMIGVSSAATLNFGPADNADGYIAYYANGAEQYSNNQIGRAHV